MSHRAIVVAGPMGAGKDYVAERISAAVSRVGVPSPIYRVGEYYYDVVAQRHGISPEEVLSRKPEFRAELQEVGSDRTAQANAIALTRLRIERSSGLPVVIARKPCEISSLQRVGCAAIAVDAPESERLERIRARDGVTPTPRALSHAVEVPALDLPCDLLILNDDAAGALSVDLVMDRDVSGEASAGELWLQNNHGSFRCAVAPTRLATVISLERVRFERGRKQLLDSLYRSGLFSGMK